MPKIGPKLVPKIGQKFLLLENKKKLANWPGKGALVEAYAKGHVLKPAGSHIVANGVPEAQTGHRPKYHLPKGSTAPIILTRTPVQPGHDFEPKWPLDQVGWLLRQPRFGDEKTVEEQFRVPEHGFWPVCSYKCSHLFRNGFI